jgi:hypothetical protein
VARRDQSQGKALLEGGEATITQEEEEEAPPSPRRQQEQQQPPPPLPQQQQQDAAAAASAAAAEAAEAEAVAAAQSRLADEQLAADVAAATTAARAAALAAPWAPFRILSPAPHTQLRPPPGGENEGPGGRAAIAVVVDTRPMFARSLTARAVAVGTSARSLVRCSLIADCRLQIADCRLQHYCWTILLLTRDALVLLLVGGSRHGRARRAHAVSHVAGPVTGRWW